MMSNAICRTCGGSPGHHVPSMLDPNGVGDLGHKVKHSGEHKTEALASPALPQDNEPLREKIIEAVTPYSFGEDGHLTALSDKDCYQWINAIVALFQAEQTRLKAELIAQVRESLPTDELITSKYGYTSDEKKYGFRIALTEVTAVLDKLEGEV